MTEISTGTPNAVGFPTREDLSIQHGSSADMPIVTYRLLAINSVVFMSKCQQIVYVVVCIRLMKHILYTEWNPFSLFLVSPFFYTSFFYIRHNFSIPNFSKRIILSIIFHFFYIIFLCLPFLNFLLSP